MTKLIRLSLVLALCLLTNATAAQDDGSACPDLLDTVQLSADTNCSALGPNELCYGHELLALAWQDDSPDSLDFINSDGQRDTYTPGPDTIFKPGQRLGLTWLKAITAGPPNPDAGTWGVAVLRIEAPELENFETEEPLVYTLYGSAALVNEVLADEAGDNWAPFQAFRLTLDEAPTCTDLPAGLVVSTPEDIRVTLLANGQEFVIGSTVMLHLERGYLYLIVTEGSASVLAGENTVSAETGQFLRVPIDPNTKHANGPVEGPFDISREYYDELPAIFTQPSIPPRYEIVPAGLPLSEGVGEERPVHEEPAMASLHFLWGSMVCVLTPAEVISEPLHIYWGIGCFDSQAHANMHPHPADYQLMVDGQAWDMSGLHQTGPHRHPPYCPWGWSFHMDPIELEPGKHTLTLVETVTDTWSGVSGGRNAGEVVTLSCTVEIVP